MDTTMEREPLMLRLSQDTDTTAMVMDMDTMDMVMVMDTMDTMARDPLMLMSSQLPMLSQAMDTMDMVMDMDMAMATMDTATDTDMDTTDKQLKSFLLSSLEFSTKMKLDHLVLVIFKLFQNCQ